MIFFGTLYNYIIIHIYGLLCTGNQNWQIEPCKGQLGKKKKRNSGIRFISGCAELQNSLSMQQKRAKGLLELPKRGPREILATQLSRHPNHFLITPTYKQGCKELTGFTDSPWSGSFFTFPSKTLMSKCTILYLMLFRVLLLSQDLMKIKHQISILNNQVPKWQPYFCAFQWWYNVMLRETK